MAGGWGIGAWGGSPWGTGLSAGVLSIGALYPVGSHVLRVEFTSAPEARPGFPGSALDPDLWTVTRLDTLERLYVLSVGVYDAPLVFDLLLQKPLGSNNALHRIQTTGIRDPSGSYIAPITADVGGTLDHDLATVQRRIVRRRQALTDLRSVSSPYIDQFGGSLRVTAAGDYERESGVSLVRKLILRRLMTRPGEFYHLPKYGLGIRVKEPLPNQSMVVMKNAIQKQVMLEPEVADASVSLTQYADKNILLIQVQARLRKTGETFSLDLPIDLYVR